MEKKKLLIIGGASLAAIVIGYIVIGKARARKYVEEVYSGASTAVLGEFPLRYGSRGGNVEKLQEYLNAKILPPLAKLDVDGIFGSLTQYALKSVTGKDTMTEDEFKKIV